MKEIKSIKMASDMLKKYFKDSLRKISESLEKCEDFLLNELE